MSHPNQTIVPHLWFDKEAREAAEFYVSVFGEGSAITSLQTLHDTPSEDCDVVNFDLWGYSFMGISAGPLFKFNSSISFFVNFDTSMSADAQGKLDAMWEKLSKGGTIAMPLDEYFLGKRYGWIEDKYGVSWQLILTDPEGEDCPLILPSLPFVSDTGDKAEETTDFYLSVFKNAKRGAIAHYPAGMEPNKEGAVMFTDFMLEGQWFAAMDGSTSMHNFDFNEAISLVVHCDTQQEIDDYWEKLSAVPEAEQCGWLKDKYGVSWQIVPRAMSKMMQNATPEQVDRITQAFLPMKKMDIAALEKAYKGE